MITKTEILIMCFGFGILAQFETGWWAGRFLLLSGIAGLIYFVCLFSKPKNPSNESPNK